MRKSSILSISTLLLCTSMLISCTSCSQQSVSPKPKPEEPLKLLWSFAFTQPVEGISTVTLPPALTADGAVITALDRQYSSLSQQDGSLHWQHAIPDSGWESVKRLTLDDTYVYGKIHRDSTYFAINLHNGDMAWQKINDEGPFYHYTHDGVDERHLYLAGDDSVIYIYNKINGAYEQQIPLQSWARVITPKGNALYVSQAWKPVDAETANGRIIRIDAETHQTQWEYHTTNGGYYNADVIVQDGVVYSGTVNSGEFVALDARTGTPRWKQTEFLTYRFTLAQDTLYINNGSGILALDARDGQELWSYDYGDSGINNVTYLNGYVYSAHAGGVYIFDAKTGEKVADPVYAPDDSGFYNLNTANGKVFVQSSYHLYCYEAYRGGSDE